MKELRALHARPAHELQEQPRRAVVLCLVQMLGDRSEPNGYLPFIREQLPGTPGHEVLLQVAIGDHPLIVEWDHGDRVPPLPDENRPTRATVEGDPRGRTREGATAREQAKISPEPGVVDADLQRGVRSGLIVTTRSHLR